MIATRMKNIYKKSQKFKTTYFIVAFLICGHVDISLSAVAACGGRLEGETGTFTSPNYPYPHYSSSGGRDDGGAKMIDCVWEIIVPEGLGIHLNFGDFRMAAGQDECRKGQIEISTGIGENKKFQDLYCGSDEISVVNLKVNSATVLFRRPENFVGSGFLVSYIATHPPQHTVNDFVTCVDKGMKHIGVEELSVICPGGCANLSNMAVIGSSNNYRDDAHLCKAAVHAGVISDRKGGRIYVERKPGMPRYDGSFANGIESEGAAMSDMMFSFANYAECRDNLKFGKEDLSASSEWVEHDEQSDTTYIWAAARAQDTSILAWSPADLESEQWLQIDLKQIKNITTIITSGAQERGFFVTQSYHLKYSNDGLNWTSYKEEGTGDVKVHPHSSNYGQMEGALTWVQQFTASRQFFDKSRNNFIRPTIIARYVRVYPKADAIGEKNYRYALRVSLKGCNIIPVVVPTLPPTIPSTDNTSTTAIKTTVSTPHVAPKTDSPIFNENSIIVIGIVAALAVTSILLASCVLILVRKRKRGLKIVKGHIQQDSIQLNNNNLAGQYLNGIERKKSKSRNSKPAQSRNETIQFQNINYKDTIINAGPGQIPSTALLQGQPSVPLMNGYQAGETGKIEMTDSYDSGDDHEYQIIPDENFPLAPPSVHSQRTGSSKHSTGSSIHSKKSDTMQRGVWGDPLINSPSFDTNTPTFPLHQSFRQHNPPHPPVMSTFAPPGHNNHKRPLRSNSAVTASQVPKLPKSNPRRPGSQSPNNMYYPRMSSSSNEYAGDNNPNSMNYPRKLSLGARPFYSATYRDGDPSPPFNTQNGGYPPHYQHPSSNAPLMANNQRDNNFANEFNQNGELLNHHKSQSESLRQAKQRQGYDRLYRNNSSPTNDQNSYPHKLSLQQHISEIESMNSYDKLDLGVV